MSICRPQSAVAVHSSILWKGSLYSNIFGTSHLSPFYAPLLSWCGSVIATPRALLCGARRLLAAPIMRSTLNSIKICENGGHVSRVVAALCPGTLPCVSCALRWRSALCARDARGDVWALVMEVWRVPGRSVCLASGGREEGRAACPGPADERLARLQPRLPCAKFRQRGNRNLYSLFLIEGRHKRR